MIVFIPHIFSLDLANSSLLSDNGIGLFQQVGNSWHLKDVLFFYIFAHGQNWKAHQQEKADKSYLCSCVDSVFENVKLTLSHIPITFTVNWSHVTTEKWHPLPHLLFNILMFAHQMGPASFSGNDQCFLRHLLWEPTLSQIWGKSNSLEWWEKHWLWF